jgi:hypothetical protein
MGVWRTTTIQLKAKRRPTARLSFVYPKNAMYVLEGFDYFRRITADVTSNQKGLSGRALRRLPLLAHAASLTKYGGDQISMECWIESMKHALEGEKRQKELAEAGDG